MRDDLIQDVLESRSVSTSRLVLMIVEAVAGWIGLTVVGQCQGIGKGSLGLLGDVCHTYTSLDLYGSK